MSIRMNTNTMTEKDAKKRWCPWARFGFIEPSILPLPPTLVASGRPATIGLMTAPSANRLADSKGYRTNPAECRCIAGECMAWRWAPPGNRGYCGAAAGPPEQFVITSELEQEEGGTVPIVGKN